MAKEPRCKVCPICGDKVLATRDKEECDECDWPYELEELEEAEE